jgi:hypothetical protein
MLWVSGKEIAKVKSVYDHGSRRYLFRSVKETESAALALDQYLGRNLVVRYRNRQGPHRERYAVLIDKVLKAVDDTEGDGGLSVDELRLCGVALQWNLEHNRRLLRAYDRRPTYMALLKAIRDTPVGPDKGRLAQKSS